MVFVKSLIWEYDKFSCSHAPGPGYEVFTGVSNSNGGKNEADALFEGGFYSRAASNTDDTVYIGKWINAKLQSSR